MGECETTEILLSNITDFILYRPKKTAVLEKLAMHNNNFLLSLSRLVQNRFYAIGSLYDITTMSASVGQIKSAVGVSLLRLFESFNIIV